MISIAEIEKLAELSRIALSSEEKEAMRKDLESILGYVGEIKNLSVDFGAEKKAGALRNVMREDGKPHEVGIFSETLLSAAPRREGQYVRVKKIL